MPEYDLETHIANAPTSALDQAVRAADAYMQDAGIEDLPGELHRPLIAIHLTQLGVPWRPPIPAGQTTAGF